MMTTLYSFFNSSASYRVRIALALKGIEYSYQGVNIRHHKGEEYQSFKKEINKAGLVPSLENNEITLSQSLAIIDYLDHKYPLPRLIPQEPPLRAKVLEFSYAISCDIHPLNNLKVLRYLLHKMEVSHQKKDIWYAHWIEEGFYALEKLLDKTDSKVWCFANTPTLADCCLIPQVANALRMKCNISHFKRINAIYDNAMTHKAFQLAKPENQPDYQP